MGSGDPCGIQNRRELASLALVSSTLTRFRHPSFDSASKILRYAQDFGSRLGRRESASSSTLTRFRQFSDIFPAEILRLLFGKPQSRSGFRLAARTPR